MASMRFDLPAPCAGHPRDAMRVRRAPIQAPCAPLPPSVRNAAHVGPDDRREVPHGPNDLEAPVRLEILHLDAGDAAGGRHRRPRLARVRWPRHAAPLSMGRRARERLGLASRLRSEPGTG